MNSRTDEEDDLQLRIRRESIPLVRRAAGGSNVVKGDLAGQLPREMGLRGGASAGILGTSVRGYQSCEKLEACPRARATQYVQWVTAMQVPTEAIQSALTQNTPSKIPDACDVPEVEFPRNDAAHDQFAGYSNYWCLLLIPR